MSSRKKKKASAQKKAQAAAKTTAESTLSEKENEIKKDEEKKTDEQKNDAEPKTEENKKSEGNTKAEAENTLPEAKTKEEKKGKNEEQRTIDVTPASEKNDELKKSEAEKSKSNKNTDIPAEKKSTGEKAVPEKEDISQKKPEKEMTIQEELAEEAEPLQENTGSGIRGFFKKLVAIITAPEDNDLTYGDEELEDIFTDDESIEEAPVKHTPGNGRKKELPKTLITSSLYTANEKSQEPSAKKNGPEKKGSVKTNEKPEEKEKASPGVQTELKEHVSVKNPEEKKDDRPAPKNQKKPKNKKAGTSEITVDEIIKARDSVPQRSSKAYGELDTADKKERESETEIPIYVNRNDSKKINSSDRKKTKVSDDEQTAEKTNSSFDLNELSYETAPAEIKNELSHDEAAKPAEPARTERKNELSHEEAAKPSEAAKLEKKNELSHDKTAKPAEAAKSEKKNELSHDEAAKPAEPVRTEQKNELSHDVPVKPEKPARSEQKNELSRESLIGPSIAEKKAAEIADDTKNTDKKPETADSLPGGQGVRIDPWTQKKTGSSDKKNFAEGRSDQIVYRSPEKDPFIVMAGKFTRTLKGEYDNTRRLRGSNLPPTPPSDTPPQEEPVKQKAEKPDPAQAQPKKMKKKTKSVKNDDKPSEKNGTEPSRTVSVKELGEKEREKKKKFRFSDIFTYEGDSFNEEEEENVDKPELSDYSSKEDADEIKGDINENFRKVFVRTIVLTCTCVASVAASIIAKWMPWVFLNLLKNGWLIYSALMFVLFAVSVFISRYPIANGFMPLRKLRGNSDTPVSVASLAVGVQSVISLFMPGVFLDETYHIYVPLLILSLLLNSMGKLLIIRRTADNFRFLCSKEAKYAGKIYTKSENADRFVSGLPSRKPIIAYSKRSKFMSNFLQLSYAADPVEELSAFFAPIAAAVSVVCAVVYGILTKDFAGGVSSFALSACITIPMCSLLAINIPMLNLCSTANKNGAMVVGYEAVKQFCDTNTIMIDSSDLYPKGSIILSGMKTINESKLQEAISAGAAMTFAVNGPLTHVFETIVRQSKYKLPDFDSVSYDDEMGLSGWSNGNRILIGRREFFEKHNIRLPDEEIEKKYRKRGNEIAYISVGGELAVMFILTYKADRAIAQSLRSLEDSGVNFVVRTIDPNITQQHIADKFSLYPRCIKILPTGLGMLCHDELSSKEKSSRAYLVTNGKLSSFANAVSGCIKIRSTVTIAKIVQYLAIIIGFILVTVISFISGFAKLGSFELLIYTGFWCAALIIVSIAARRVS